MGLISFIFNNKEITELEEIIPILWDKIKSYYNDKVMGKSFHYTENDINHRSLRQRYGSGKIIKPQSDLPDFLEKELNKIMKEEGWENSGRMVVLKNNEYNYLMMSLAEFSNKSNRYIQVMHKTNLQISAKMQQVFQSYQETVKYLNQLYIYVVE